MVSATHMQCLQLPYGKLTIGRAFTSGSDKRLVRVISLNLISDSEIVE